jgi:predicted AlkP superfamily pyrophosphatase or phosphodiesterase
MQRASSHFTAGQSHCFAPWSAIFAALFLNVAVAAQAPKAPSIQRTGTTTRPKLVVLLVVDQFRADYVEKFRQQWNGGLKRLMEQGAWFREAAYPYAATLTCVGHATISTGAFPATHGIVGNTWWDREQGKVVTCTSDLTVRNIGYGASVKGGDSAWRLQVPTFANELRFQTSDARIATFSLKARSAIMLAGARADAVAWHDVATGAWATSSAYGEAGFVAEYVNAHPVSADYGKTWSAALPSSAYLYEQNALGKVPPPGWTMDFPHPLRGVEKSTGPDAAFYTQWEFSPFADEYLEKLGEAAVDSLKLGQRDTTDFLGISFSTLDLVGHAYGPRSHEVQDVLVRLDRALGRLLARLDARVGQDKYVVALSADHGVPPIPEEMKAAGFDAGWLNTNDAEARIEKMLEPYATGKPAVMEVGEGDVYLAPSVYERIRRDPDGMRAVTKSFATIPGVARVFRGEALVNRPASDDPFLRAAVTSFFPGRSGDFFLILKPYWQPEFIGRDGRRGYATTHGSPYVYDQRVPILLAGFGIRRGEFLNAATPADIAPTLASLCGITLAARDGRVLSEALSARKGAVSAFSPFRQKPQ